MEKYRATGQAQYDNIIRHMRFAFRVRKAKNTYSEYVILTVFPGHAVSHLVEALRYNLEERGFDSRWCHWNFSLT